MNTTTETVLAFFAQRGGVPGETLQQKLACAYLDAKLIDSMGIVEMIAEFEQTFAIRFDTDDLQSEAFLTIGGLVATIDRLRAAAAR